MKKVILETIFIFLGFLLSPAVFGQTHAAFLNFDKNTVSIGVGDTVDIQVMIDAGSDQISSTDAYVIYDPSLIEAQTITPGIFFPTVVNNITSGRLYVAGLVDDAASSKTGSGAVALITFKALTQGSGTLTYDCEAGVYNSSKIILNDLNATNIIDCGQNGTSAITIAAAGPGTGTPYPGVTKTSTSSALPKTGIFDNVSKVAVPGMILLFLGGVLRLIL
ncbi:hypothetical protein A2954_04670 [Candidatus Roizmanbacteria bacterium RIFCSPLOWO2_01_FULL_37_12]|uniref:Cohesin domain-containing protein n=1 Tax=Candidatus Roizmanbacteria bacterium RIFCSPLOWO2_01_FULL_37_12 TaxID=1802056 RepID=A0A1F7IFY9_9BACT|nr:MAG: hypothetical protein A3D76_06120 [Candidatus Roizmanbacteria bacterium RIFCSPHIGHO2_02_FULL_37_9b]OGK42275.1 MAG: hypothetical protein A2954_04670 [Candidatus Roizmanbacteria bacterium RIFCSPLOWO2_01_FULL_37_12]